METHTTNTHGNSKARNLMDWKARTYKSQTLSLGDDSVSNRNRRREDHVKKTIEFCFDCERKDASQTKHTLKSTLSSIRRHWHDSHDVNTHEPHAMPDACPAETIEVTRRARATVARAQQTNLASQQSTLEIGNGSR
jgi:hypothetical protein